ncbi:MAG: hypothetical protein KDA61_21355, partial [Planctomycetales bacterium]|nr:hypothetical protein [Planctomycetales bacterium]
MSDSTQQLRRRAQRDYLAARSSDAYLAAMGGSKDAKSAAGALALAQGLGYCRLWGVDLGELDGSVPKSLLTLACTALELRIGELIQQLTAFEQSVEIATDEMEVELRASVILRQRMDGWACWTALDERAQMFLEQEPGAATNVVRRIESLAAAIEQWDVDLQARSDL